MSRGNRKKGSISNKSIPLVESFVEHPRINSMMEMPASDSLTTNPIVPRVHMVNGVVMINEDSMLFIPEAKVDDLKRSNAIDEAQSRVTSASYSKRTVSLRWDVQDTLKFYRLLRRFGANFAMIQRSFPDRTRRQIKNKYAKELSTHPSLIYRVTKCSSKQVCTFYPPEVDL